MRDQGNLTVGIYGLAQEFEVIDSLGVDGVGPEAGCGIWWEGGGRRGCVLVSYDMVEHSGDR